MGELLAEIMRPDVGASMGRVGAFIGPFPSGAPGIFIDTVARLGHSAGIVSGVGKDAFGQAILERLERDGVRTDLVEVVPDRSTGVAFIAYDHAGERDYIFHWADTPAVLAPAPPAEIAKDARWFHVMGCSLLPDRAFAKRIIETAERFAAAGARISFDPNVRPELLGTHAAFRVIEPMLERCSILLPSEAELGRLSGSTDMDAKVEAVVARYGIQIVVVKLGARGCVVYSADRDGDLDRIEVPAFEIEQVDATGAGDCFDAGFVCGILEGLDLAAAARMGAAAGALNAATMGPMEGAIDRHSVAALMATIRGG